MKVYSLFFAMVMASVVNGSSGHFIRVAGGDGYESGRNSPVDLPVPDRPAPQRVARQVMLPRQEVIHRSPNGERPALQRQDALRSERDAQRFFFNQRMPLPWAGAPVQNAQLLFPDNDGDEQDMDAIRAEIQDRVARFFMRQGVEGHVNPDAGVNPAALAGNVNGIPSRAIGVRDVIPVLRRRLFELEEEFNVRRSMRECRKPDRYEPIDFRNKRKRDIVEDGQQN